MVATPEIGDKEQEAIDNLVHCARRFVECADEFWPEHPNALGEFLDELDAARDKLEKVIGANDNWRGEFSRLVQRARDGEEGKR